jgi:hypothetical protein
MLLRSETPCVNYCLSKCAGKFYHERRKTFAEETVQLTGMHAFLLSTLFANGGFSTFYTVGIM